MLRYRLYHLIDRRAVGNEYVSPVIAQRIASDINHECRQLRYAVITVRNH